MKALLSALISFRGLCGLVGALLLAVVIWLFAPALGINALWLLLLLTVLPVLIWFTVMAFLVRRAQKRDAALVAGATQTDDKAAKAGAKAAAASEEERAVAGRLADALAAMKAAGGGKGGYLYERPWYVLIGPPGSGKTTAIRNSGLDFPLAEGRVSGVGGTRNCDWWIAEQAVLIDTAGRYTTQDSDASADKAGWERFLELLRRERPRQPLNGVVVAFGADMLSRLDPAGREQHAQAVRRRVRELEQKLGQRLPVYFLISKADLVVGFSEFFDDLDRESRGQVWGMTFAAEAGAEGPVTKFAAEFSALVQRLQDRVLERLQAERGAEQRARIAGFPAQFASLEAPLGAFMQAAFGGSKLDPAPFLRGLYFTSGTQEGTPIDRLTGALSRAFGLDPRRPAAVMGQKGRSYFLGRLLRDVVFNEARLAARDRGHERRRRLVQIGVVAASVVLLLGGAALGWYALNIESTRDRQTAAAVEAAETSAKGLPLDVVAPADDLSRVLPYLDSAGALPPAAQGAGGRLGLSQEDKLVGAGQVAYKHALERVMLPRLLSRLEGQIRAGMQKPAYLYVATRVYLMLGRQGPLDASLIKEWMAADWAQAYPGAVAAPTRDKLMAHLDALLGQDFSTYALDGVLVDTARRVFSRLPMADRVYARLRNTATDAAPWRPADALGPSGQRLFTLQAGKPITEAAVPGLFTVEGLYRSFLPRLPKGILEAASESWVLGPEAAAAAASNPQQLEGDVLRLYAQDYIAEWQKLLDSIALAPFGSPTKSAEALNLLGAPNSPLRDLMQGIAKQLSPGTAPPAVAAGAAATTAAVKGVTGAAVKGVTSAAPAVPGAGAVTAGAAGRLAESIGIAAPTSSASVVAKTVEDHFRPLREAAGKPLDGVIAVLNELYVQVAKVATAAPGGAAPPPAAGLDPGQRLMAEAQRAPEPLSRWLSAAAQATSAVRAGGTRATVAAAAAQQLAPFCKGVETRFPFRRDAAAPDMPMDDFVRLFGPGGAFELFFNQNLKAIVDTSQRPWRPAVADGGPPPVSPSDIAQFQRAAAIRDAFFPAALPGQPSSALRFELVPVSLDAGAKGAVLEVDGAKTAIAPGAAGARAAQLQWPSKGNVSLSFDGEASTLSNDGPWAALRFVARGKLQPTSVPDRLRLSLQQGARSGEFELRTGSIVHPFALRELAEFRCPQLTP
ncbi:type VI secretion system membrane subunit TssM [Aquabacterium sp.]|uniref:type VI secretion system membrane subunit TssM n=1 Tax=Aquabacterium sp. TaxID=1872578 RepID=UPI002D058EDB|nr:type VI secretion system membrane subunit TssM [Aquabacterium sp.]HSW03527.1 type VI secretion system membrane subunit TssM [Aquabacterium sp.]